MLKSMKYLKYTQKELQSYCKDSSACIKCVTDEISIGIKPAGLSCFREAVTDALVREKVGYYDAKLKGIVLDVRNIKVLGNGFAHIHNDSSILHIQTRADLYIFEPRIDAVVKGIVKHIAPAHISVTIHKVFNVAVSNLLSGPKRDLAVNNEVTIKITKFDLNYQIPYIEAVLVSPRRIIVFEDSDKNGLAQDSGISTEGSSKDVGKVKKRARSTSSSEEDSDSDAVESKTISLLDFKTVIKQEPHSNENSSSESDAEDPPKLNRRTRDSSGSDSDEYKKTITVKKEKHSCNSSSDESVKKQRSNNSDSDGVRSDAAGGNSNPDLSIFSASEHSDSSITPYQKPKSKAATLPPKKTIKTEEIMPNSPDKTTPNRHRLQSPPAPAEPVSPATSTISFAAKRKRRSSIAPKIDEIISKHIRIKTEAILPLPTPPPSPAKTKKTPSTPAPLKARAKKTPPAKVTGPPKITIKSEEITKKPPLKGQKLQSPPPATKRSASPVSPASPTPSFAEKRKRRNSNAIDEIISKHIRIKTETTDSIPTMLPTLVPSKVKPKEKALPLTTVTQSKTIEKQNPTVKAKKTIVKIEPGTPVDMLPSAIKTKSPKSVTDKMAERYEISKKTRASMDALVFKVLAEKAAKSDRAADSDCAHEADTARKALKLSQNLPYKIMKEKKTKRDVESLMLKVMAHKICEILPDAEKSPSTQNSSIANASQFESPALSSTRNDSKPAKKLKSKKTELLNKMLSKHY